MNEFTQNTSWSDLVLDISTKCHSLDLSNFYVIDESLSNSSSADVQCSVTEPITYSAALINGCECHTCRKFVMANVSFAVTYGLIFLSNEAFPLVFVSGFWPTMIYLR